MYTGVPDMVGNIMINLSTVIVDNNNVSFRLNWDEPFDNFGPIVEYAVNISCNSAHCPIVFYIAATGVTVHFNTDLSMMTPLSVTARNKVGTSDPGTIVIDGK